jgi:hypothetical protein
VTLHNERLEPKAALRLKPIFDTNVFGHVQSGLIPQSDWQFLLQRRPRHGWPLSVITVLELLAGLDGIPSEKFPDLKAQVSLAFNLSRGRILEDPTLMLCRDVLHIPIPADLVAPSGSVLQRHMDLLRRAATLGQLLQGLPYKGLHARFQDLSAVNDIVSDLKSKWVNGLEVIATAHNPTWRELFRKRGRRLPPGIRRQIDPPSAWNTEKRAFIEILLRDLLKTKPEPALVDVMMEKLSAVLEFTVFVLHAFLTGNYSLERNSSDVFDQFQLRYLAKDSFVVVTGDADLSNRTVPSSQTHRVMTFHDFLQTL